MLKAQSKGEVKLLLIEIISCFRAIGQKDYVNPLKEACLEVFMRLQSNELFSITLLHTLELLEELDQMVTNFKNSSSKEEQKFWYNKMKIEQYL